MKTAKLFILPLAFSVFSVMCTSAVQAQQWQMLLDEATILSVTGDSDIELQCLTALSDGRFIVADDLNDKLLLLDPNGATPTDKVKVMANQTDIFNAIDSANGTSPAPTVYSPRGSGVNSAGKFLFYSDGASEPGTVIALEPTAPYTISVLSTSVNGNPSPVEGGAGMWVGGNTAYLLVERNFGAAEDAVLKLDVSTIVNDGSLVPTTLTGETDLLTATGEASNSSLAVNCTEGISPSATEIIVGNSGSGSSNDNLISINVSTGAASLYLQATDIEADLPDSDIGFSDIAISPNGDIILTNSFGGASFDDGVIHVTGITPPNGTATGWSETTIATDVGQPSGQVSHQDENAVWDATRNAFVIASDGNLTEGLLMIQMPPATVGDWNLY
ncbi:MAG: hypothetical protein Kow0059_20350 [Candidatus Sumerlaeia bacterium]